MNEFFFPDRHDIPGRVMGAGFCRYDITTAEMDSLRMGKREQNCGQEFA